MSKGSGNGAGRGIAGDERPIVVWLRNDLRLDDNPALAHAAATGRPVVPLLVLDEEGKGGRPIGGAHKWWLHHSILALSQALEAAGSGLVLRRGASADVVPALVREAGAGALWFNRRYDQAADALDDEIADSMPEIDTEAFRGHILHDPAAVKTKTGGYYKVYTPFWKTLTSGPAPRDPIDAPTRIARPAGGLPASDDLGSWALLPTGPDWSAGFAPDWVPGEASAHKRFALFCETLLDDYPRGRERPAEDATSRMSPHLRWGEISPFRLWREADAAAARRPVPAGAMERFRKELVWRDFNYHLLFHFGPLASRNVNARFDAFPWRTAPGELRAWRKGLTGYPIVDAGMRQLWQTGWMHNRLRLITGSFLTKDLLIDWREGERWFWDTLIDGDEASNTSQWQWIGGSGADAQPFFRIFNPVAQGRKFDAAGDYIRRYVPELAALSGQDIHAPWTADAAVLAKAGVELGKTYPAPIVDHAEARDRALAAFRSLRRGAEAEPGGGAPD